ncbi:hypothetical protein TI39_contig592g00005 [Zymoseptoria brevis]|uniref:Uncharacterized protein n=1 Tax=Zymoseptoria brevis TaxID=1047168 RepID=A0A0F4GHT7_9PEZI|nr:hypothetical protein TI39_contig592g00005 [Zymoseptoria brevis]
MSTHTTAGLHSETPSNSETAVGGEAGANIVPKASETAPETGDSQQSKSMGSSQPGSAEAAAEKLYEERMEDEYAKREGGA